MPNVAILIDRMGFVRCDTNFINSNEPMMKKCLLFALAGAMTLGVLHSCKKEENGEEPVPEIDDLLSAAYIPGPAFLEYCKAQTAWDTNGDGKLSSIEAAAVKEIEISRRQIASLEGIEYFTALTTLYCYDNYLTTLDLSKNTALTELWCHNNPGDGVSKFPIKAWFDDSTIPSHLGRGGWYYNGKRITVAYYTGN